MKVRTCKCGHDKKQHTRFQCGLCPCCVFTRRDSPDMFDKIFFYIGFVVIIILSLPVFLLGTIPFDFVIELTVSDIFVVALVVFLLYSILIYDSMIADYFFRKGRRIF